MRLVRTYRTVKHALKDLDYGLSAERECPITLAHRLLKQRVRGVDDNSNARHVSAQDQAKSCGHSFGAHLGPLTAPLSHQARDLLELVNYPTLALCRLDQP